jgi:hypothetical protein
MAPNVSWLVIMWFLHLQVPEGLCVHSQIP